MIIDELPAAGTADWPCRPDVQALADSVPALVFVTDANGRNIYTNGRYASFTGLSAAALQGDNWLRALHPDDRARAGRNWTTAVAAAEPYEAELRFLDRDGAPHWFLCRAAPVKERGHIVRWVGSCVEIEDRKQAEDALAASEAWYRATYEHSGAGMAHVALDGRFVTVNDRFCNIVGWPREALLQTDFQHITDPADLPQDEQNVAALLDGRLERYSMRKRYLRQDGGSVEALLTVGLARDEQGAPSHFVSVVEEALDRPIAPPPATKRELNRHETDQLSRWVLQSSPDCIKVLSAEGLVEYFSAGGLRAMEVDDFAAQVASADWVSFWSEADRPAVRDAVAAAKAGGTGRFQAFCPSVRGTPKWWDVSVTSIPADGETPAKLLVMSRDVTALHRAEERIGERETALGAREAQLRTILDTVPVGIVLAELPSGRIVEGNKYIETLLRHPVLPSADIDSYDEWVSFHPDGRQVQGHDYPLGRIALHGEEHPELDVHYQRGDGTRAWTRISGRPVRDQNNAVIGGVVALVDIDTERRAAEALKESERRFRQLAETIREVFYVVELDENRISYVSPAYRELWGRSEEELYADLWSFLTVVHPDDRPAAEAALAEQNAGRNTSSEYRLLRDDGSVRHILDRAFVVRDPDTGARRAVGIAEDVTERKRAEQDLADALEAKEALLYEVNHRIKNSLQLVTSLLALSMRGLEDEKARQALAEAQNRIHVMGRLHQQLYQSGTHGKLDLAAFLQTLIPDTLASLGADGRVAANVYNDCDVELSLDRAIPLTLMIAELLINAVKYAFPDQRGGGIAVGLACADDELSVLVEDDGVGLPAEFDPKKSTGVGMRIITALTRQLRGRLDVVPRERGAAFRITIPR